MKSPSKERAPVWALGAVSDTALLGVRAAMVRTDGEHILEFGETGFRAYSGVEQATIRTAHGRWSGDPGVSEAAEVVETALAELLSQFQADLIGIDGHTLAHNPGGRRIRQIGHGGLLATVLETPVVWGFRSADMALGGQGAPLTPAYHHACARWVGVTAPIAVLDLEQSATLTYVDPARGPEACLAFDTGPALGAIGPEDSAAQGWTDAGLVAQVLAHPFFLRMPPKYLGLKDIAEIAAMLPRGDDPDAAATRLAICTGAVAHGFQHLPARPDALWISGLGRKSDALRQGLRDLLRCEVLPVGAIGLDADTLDAQAMAHLAVRVSRGLPTTWPSTTGVAAAVGGGTLSRPGRYTGSR